MAIRRALLIMCVLFALCVGQSVALNIPALVQAAQAYHNQNQALETVFRSALLDAIKLVQYTPDGTAYVATGDIPAEWLRDASAEMRIYLYYAKDDPDVRAVLRAVIAREAKYVQVDPYANAFTLDYRVWEEKYELDSLAYPVMLAWSYWKVTGDASIFTPDFHKALADILATMHTEQHHGELSRYTEKELADSGKGRPSGYTGMIWTGFRPSDDACYYNYLIPSEMMAVVALNDIEEIERTAYHDRTQARIAANMRESVQHGIETYGIVNLPKYGKIYAYEVDGLGHAILTDDANVPSLLSAPYIGYTSENDPVYRDTRAFLLSLDNPSYYTGTVARGIGSYHTPDHWVWPLAIVVEGMTATSADEKTDALDQLLASDPGDHLLHESFDPDDPKRYTRTDFGWPNALFSEFVLTMNGTPEIPMGDFSSTVKEKNI